ncbi:hypothetical protein F0562_020047 [Nyssa sinensis]|uniref:Uncharacterized protein n=1 Tax=Nyssa sinensis TaxID=561372 RepID=A0A5J5BQ29_9ASTE|nr:hypothetical protein F0562_020047 [Nyssa sinensis]
MYSLIMKITSIILLLIVGSALLCLQANGRRFVLEQERKKDKADTQLIADAKPAQKLDGVNNGAIDTKPSDNTGRSGTYGPVLSAVDNDNKSNNGNNEEEEEKNDSYGNYVLLITGSVLPCLQASGGRRLVLEEGRKKEKADTQLKPDAQPAGRKLDGVNSGATDTKPNGNTEKSSTYGPVLLTADNNNEKKRKTANNNNNNNEDEENDCYGDYDGFFGSSGDNRHFFPPDFPYHRHNYGNNNNNKEHEKNDCYGSPYESATDPHHIYPDDRRPPH